MTKVETRERWRRRGQLGVAREAELLDTLSQLNTKGGEIMTTETLLVVNVILTAVILVLLLFRWRP